MEVELHLGQLAVDLDRAARHARERIQKANQQASLSLADEVEHRRWLNTVLQEMVAVLDRTTRGDDASNERRLYVWPGYDSVRLGGTRIGFEVEPQIAADLVSCGYDAGLSDKGVPRKLPSGASFPPALDCVDRATLYYDAALGPLSHSDAKRGTFSTGGTHNWLALSPAIADDPMIGFEVRVDGEHKEGHHSFLTISLDPANPLGWGDALAEEIRRNCEETPTMFWPLPTRLKGESQESHRARLAIEYRSVRNREIRQRLYSLWMIGCFCDRANEILLSEQCAVWLDGLIAALDELEPERARRLRALRAVEQRIRDGERVPLENTHYSSWGVVTIPYPIADTRSSDTGDESDDLGSGMLLSNFTIPHWYYYAIRQWIASYYLSLRQHENSFLAAERKSHEAALDAERLLRRQLSHAIGTELTFVEFLVGEAEKSFAADLFEPRAGMVRKALASEGQTGKYVGIPKPFEIELAKLLTNFNDQIDHNIALMQAALAALPSDKVRHFIHGMSEEVRRINLENRALVRVDDAGVLAEFERNNAPTGDDNAIRLVELLRRALLVAVTVYFRKAYPGSGDQGEAICLESARSLFSSETMARDCAIAWRKMIAASYRETGTSPTYEVLRQWLTAYLSTQSQISFELPQVDDMVRIRPGCGEFAPMVVQAWLTEALLNALKHARVPTDQGRACMAVEWLSGDAVLAVSNTTSTSSGQQVVAGIEATTNGMRTIKEGHQGLAFLAYAAKHLFDDARLHGQLDEARQVLKLYVA